MARGIVRGIESWVTFWIGLAFLIVFVLPFTRLVYNPQAIEIAGKQVTMYRSFPGDALGLPRPRMSYVETITPLTPRYNGGQPCVAKGGPFRYASAEPVGEWSIAWADACTSDPHGYRWEAMWVWHIGAIRTGPVYLSHVVLRPEGR